MARVKEQIKQVSALEDNDLQNQLIAEERAKQRFQIEVESAHHQSKRNGILHSVNPTSLLIRIAYELGIK